MNTKSACQSHNLLVSITCHNKLLEKLIMNLKIKVAIRRLSEINSFNMMRLRHSVKALSG